MKTLFYVVLYPTKHSTILQQRHYSNNNNPIYTLFSSTLSLDASSTESIIMPHISNNDPVTIVHGKIACLPEWWSKLKVKHTRIARYSLGRRGGIDANFKFNPKKLNLNERLMSKMHSRFGLKKNYVMIKRFHTFL